MRPETTQIVKHVDVESTKYLYRLFVWLINLFDWYIKVRENEGYDEETVPSQPAPVPLTIQAAAYLWALRGFVLFTNQPQFTAASGCHAEECFESELCNKANGLSKQL